MGIALERGRFFTPQDDAHSPRVAAVDEVFARKFFPNQDAIGKRIRMNMSDASAVEIVGVVGHVKQWGLDVDDTYSLRAQIYLPCMQMPDDFVAMAPSGSSMVIRSVGSTSGLFDALRHASAQMNQEQVVYGAQTMDAVIASSLASRRFVMILLGVFAGLALVLACVGIYGVLSYLVEQRTHEIGIRMALGAQQLQILRLILARGGLLAVAGVGCGLAAAVGLTRLMAGLLYGIGATDPITFAAVALLLLFVALAACFIPAHRAAKVDPMIALRYE
jgi:predicted permease